MNRFDRVSKTLGLSSFVGRAYGNLCYYTSEVEVDRMIDAQPILNGICDDR